MRFLSLFAAAAVLSACAGVSEVTANKCPVVDVLATADTMGEEATLTGATLKCFISKKQDNRLLAQVDVQGTAVAGASLPIFVAAIDREDKLIARTQYQLTAKSAQFQLSLPAMDYGQKGDDKRPRVVVGFVLSDKQLADNRARYRTKLGLSQ